MVELPRTIAECDKQLTDERKLLSVMLSPGSRVPILDRIDTLLDRRFELLRRQIARAEVGVTSRRSTIPPLGQPS